MIIITVASLLGIMEPTSMDWRKKSYLWFVWWIIHWSHWAIEVLGQWHDLHDLKEVVLNILFIGNIKVPVGLDLHCKWGALAAMVAPRLSLKNYEVALLLALGAPCVMLLCGIMILYQLKRSSWLYYASTCMARGVSKKIMCELYPYPSMPS